ncbi:MAG TPA: family 1 glycosylhydrolase, partial [Anaerolineae bacterium]
MTEPHFVFPPDFKWGTATAAHQVEGGNTLNQWWDWEQTPGHIANGDKSGDACGWWQDCEDDFDRMVELGTNAHRMSIEWSRIEPVDGRFDSAAMDRYRAMLQGLRQRGIEPMVTLHHFTNPRWLELQGGWENTELVVSRFKRFVSHVVQSLGNLCDLWCTINEPNVYAFLGYMQEGTMPPGIEGATNRALRVMCNMLYAHAVAYEVLHEAQPYARVGLAHHMRYFQPLNGNNPLDRLVCWVQDYGFNDGILTALFKGKWNLLLRSGATSSAHGLVNTLDWIGLNYYTRQGTAFDLSASSSLFGRQECFPGGVMSDYDYGEIYPQGVLPLLQRLSLA